MINKRRPILKRTPKVSNFWGAPQSCIYYILVFNLYKEKLLQKISYYRLIFCNFINFYVIFIVFIHFLLIFLCFIFFQRLPTHAKLQFLNCQLRARHLLCERVLKVLLSVLGCSLLQLLRCLL